MQKMKKLNYKNEKGVTLISLVITIIVAIILAAISIYTGSTSVSEIKEKQQMSTLNMVQEVVISQYAKAVSLGQTGRPITLSGDNRPSCYYGVPLVDGATYISLPTDDPTIFQTLTEYQIFLENKTYDDCYYRLTENDLENLGITASNDDQDGLHEYIVRYSTGEVYDETLREAKYYIEGTRKTVYGGVIYPEKESYEVTDFVE